ncbi:MAG: hypothetical protein AAGE13_14025, partial [Pseudomonadota bacterium]
MSEAPKSNPEPHPAQHPLPEPLPATLAGCAEAVLRCGDARAKAALSRRAADAWVASRAAGRPMA